MSLSGKNTTLVDTDTSATTGHHGDTKPGPVVGGAAGGVAGHEMGNGAAGTVLGAAAGEHHAKTHPANAAGNGTGTHGGIVGTGASAGTVGKEILGKVEHAIGTVMGSSTLKARGAEKEQSAQSEKLQNAELAQAKRLEGEAAVRREHAADQG